MNRALLGLVIVGMVGCGFDDSDGNYGKQGFGNAALAIRNAQMHQALKRKYENVVDEFHQWFEHYYTYPGRSPEKST